MSMELREFLQISCNAMQNAIRKRFYMGKVVQKMNSEFV